nr:tyrosine-type recombinase/integrase [Geodermatophilus normandii]
MHVRRQVQRSRGDPAEFRLPKYGSERVVALPYRLLQSLGRHVERHVGSAEGWLFATASGVPLPPSTVDSWWQPTIRAAGTPGLHLHALRHFYASGLIAAGCDVVTVQRALGHRSPSTTLDTYAHLWPSAEDPTRDGAAGLADLVLGPPADQSRTNSKR